MTSAGIRYMVWPPVAADASGEVVGRLISMLCWFAGPTAKSLRIPLLLKKSLLNCSLPEYASIGVFSDLHKIEFLDFSQALDLLSSERHVLLVLTRDIKYDEVLNRTEPLRGSQTLNHVTRLPRQLSESQYYYFGNPDSDIQDAYHALCLSYWVMGGEDEAFLKKSKADLLRQRRKASTKSRIALFGSGPSLSEALEADHSNSFNIICNTLIKNHDFIARLDPQILVASDAHFHFSYHRYSARFLSDLVTFLNGSGASFYTFDKFASFLHLRMPEIAHRVFGLPGGRKSYGYDFDFNFRLFPGDSVLNMFLLPMGSFLGKEVVLNGFTGRAPSDSFFWSHSELHQYTELMEDVRKAHPAFFLNRDYPRYANRVDEEIKLRVNAARQSGKVIRSATTTFYSAFQS